MKNIKFLFIAFISSLVAVSCLVDDEPSELEKGFATGEYVAGFKNTTAETNFLTDGQVGSFSLPVDLLAGQVFANTPQIDLTFEVDASSTAVEGVDFDFVSTSRVVSIPASRDFATIDFNIYTENIEPLAPKTIVIRLVNSSNGVISETQQTATIILGGICFSDVGGTFNVSVERIETGATWNYTNEVISQIGEGLYLSGSTGQFGPQGSNDLTTFGAPRNGFVFEENCDMITIESQNLGNFFSNQVEGSGTVDDAGNLTMTVTITPLFSDPVATYNIVYTKQ
ncbi:hypothetical protein ACFQ1M_01145 [Sungkyunkwania multivorans]|uniref:DUF4843 domain-containing protein n=1 Tax=Sungkyunkwania multivorans TaxID=1173618 RepID=A0ABW3CUU6_9FLAO